MKITIELDTAKGEHETPEAIALLGGSVLMAAISRAEVVLDDKIDDEPRAYGQPGTGNKKRTKDEMSIDREIEELFAKATEADIKGLPKAIPTDQPAEAVLDELRTICAEIDDEGFDIGDDDDDDEPAMDLDEFRAIIVKAAKKLGNEVVGGIMAPHKNPGSVPEGERRDYADKLVEAMG
jgi:hypothetical protein